MTQSTAIRSTEPGRRPPGTSPERFTRALADSTRLRILVLLLERGELCVCELCEALALPQPKISRHLAVLRESGMLLDRRAGLWIHYRVHPDLPAWAREALIAVGKGCAGEPPFESDRARLAGLTPGSAGSCS